MLIISRNVILKKLIEQAQCHLSNTLAVKWAGRRGNKLCWPTKTSCRHACRCRSCRNLGL